MNVSFVGSDALAKELGAGGEGVVVTQVVPHPESEPPAVTAFREAMKKHAPQVAPGFVALEGYVSARIFCEGAKKAGKDLTREGHIDALEALGGFDIGTGEKLSLSKTDHQASHSVWPTVLRGGKFVPFKWSELARQ
jgi:ABC-type branched-subunit amino acid transport system substrate-binding protein